MEVLYLIFVEDIFDQIFDFPTINDVGILSGGWCDQIVSPFQPNQLFEFVWKDRQLNGAISELYLSGESEQHGKGRFWQPRRYLSHEKRWIDKYNHFPQELENRGENPPEPISYNEIFFRSQTWRKTNTQLIYDAPIRDNRSIERIQSVLQIEIIVQIFNSYFANDWENCGECKQNEIDARNSSIFSAQFRDGQESSLPSIHRTSRCKVGKENFFLSLILVASDWFGEELEL
jgi:hypothetical protein